MIPYFQWIHIQFGPIILQVWGIFVAVGILAALMISVRVAARRGLEISVVWDLAFWMILGGILGARLVYVVSEWSLYTTAPLDVLKVWQGGMSISGGFLGALFLAWIFFRRRTDSFLAYIDIIAFGLPVGLWIGRLGCFFIYDHPGTPTRFFLGQEFIDGIVRHNHGLYLSLDGLILASIFFFLWKRQPRRLNGFYLIFFLIWDGTVRFFLDFFRAYDDPFADARFFHLTVAQFLSLGMIAVGVVLWYTLHYKFHHHGTAKKTDHSQKTSVNT